MDGWTLLKRMRREDITLLLLLLALPLSIRKVFFLYGLPEVPGFNEYTDISLYLTDLLVVGFLAENILRHKLHKTSIINKLFHVEHFRLLVLLPLPYLIWSALSIGWSSLWGLGLYRVSNQMIGYFLYLGVLLYFVPRGTISKAHAQNVPRGTIGNEECSTWNNWRVLGFGLLLTGLIQAIIAIIQVLKQGSLGLFWLGEAHLGPSRSGIAKVIMGSVHLVRAYGLTPHPNVLAAVLLVSLAVLLTYSLAVHQKLFHVEQWRGLYPSLFFLCLLAFLFTSSKGGLIGLILFGLLLVIKLFHVEHSFTHLRKLFHVEQWLVTLVLLIAICIFSFAARHSFLSQSLNERLDLQQGLYTVTEGHWITGVGIGQYVTSLAQEILGLPDWAYQSVHNIYFDVLAEQGIIGLLFFFVLWVGVPLLLFHVEQSVKHVPRGTILLNGALLGLWGAFSFMGLFDHYFYDIQQGELLFWLLLGAMAASTQLLTIEKYSS